MRGEELAKIARPVGCQKPRCSKRSGFSNWFGFPKLQGPVDGIDGIGSLGFSKIVGKTSDKVASLGTNFVGPEFF